MALLEALKRARSVSGMREETCDMASSPFPPLPPFLSLLSFPLPPCQYNNKNCFSCTNNFLLFFLPCLCKQLVLRGNKAIVCRYTPRPSISHNNRTLTERHYVGEWGRDMPLFAPTWSQMFRPPISHLLIILIRSLEKIVSFIM